MAPKRARRGGHCHGRYGDSVAITNKWPLQQVITTLTYSVISGCVYRENVPIRLDGRVVCYVRKRRLRLRLRENLLGTSRNTTCDALTEWLTWWVRVSVVVSMSMCVYVLYSLLFLLLLFLCVSECVTSWPDQSTHHWSISPEWQVKGKREKSEEEKKASTHQLITLCGTLPLTLAMNQANTGRVN